MENKVHSLRRAHRKIRIGQIALQELHAVDVGQVRPLSGDERIGHPHPLAAPDKFFGEM